MRKAFRGFFFLFIGVGLVLWIGDEIYRGINRDKLDYLDITLWEAGNYTKKTLVGEDKKWVKKVLKDLAKEGKVVWFGAPDIADCPFSAWDNWEREFYEICKDRENKWYVVVPGSSKGTSTSNYYQVDKGSALRTIDILKGFIRVNSNKGEVNYG